MSDPEAAVASQLRNIEASTGRTVADWAGVVAASGLTKHGQVVAFLKTEHALTHGNANALARRILEDAAGGRQSAAELLDAQYAGARAGLRTVYEEIVLVAGGLGPDVEVAVKKTGVSLRRARQFALVQALSVRRVQLGFNLAGVGQTTRLRTMSGMCTHAVDLVRADDVDDEVAGWLRAAYDQAGAQASGRLHATET